MNQKMIEAIEKKISNTKDEKLKAILNQKLVVLKEGKTVEK